MEIVEERPTAVMIARSATAQDDISDDGITFNVMLVGEPMKQVQRLIQERESHVERGIFLIFGA